MKGKTMRGCLLAAALIASSPALAQQPDGTAPAPARTCIRTLDIQSSMPARDEKSIIFAMRNGDRWRGDLGGQCFGIRFSGFSWDVLGDGRVCEKMQTLRVRDGGPVCILGSLTRLPKTQNKTQN